MMTPAIKASLVFEGPLPDDADPLFRIAASAFQGAELLYGPRTIVFIGGHELAEYPLGFRFVSGDTNTLYLPTRWGDSITIDLCEACRENEGQTRFCLAHEMCHLLFGGVDHASVLEEGLCVHFSETYTAAQLEPYHSSRGPFLGRISRGEYAGQEMHFISPYVYARERVTDNEITPAVVRAIRAEQPDLSKVDSTLLLKHCRTIAEGPFTQDRIDGFTEKFLVLRRRLEREAEECKADLKKMLA